MQRARRRRVAEPRKAFGCHRRGARGRGRIRARQRPVVQNDERLRQRPGVGRHDDAGVSLSWRLSPRPGLHPGVFGELFQGLMQPVAVLLDGQHLALPRRRFGSGASEGTAPELRKRYVVTERRRRVRGSSRPDRRYQPAPPRPTGEMLRGALAKPAFSMTASIPVECTPSR
jgi:hypothetical protein